ncbi:MAG TPA: MFS transporter, partial [Cyclobacteriaceae bacterium]|nr:MFS transporter [Cyclobacteriaceae bacterium]
VYSLVITSAIFPVYYKAKAVSAGGSDVVSFFGFPVRNSVLYSYALSFSFLVVAIILPLLSGMADYSGRKKFFMKIFVFIGSFSCMGLYFFKGIDSLTWGIFCSVLASIGYSGSLVFYDAFLPEIASEDRYDIVSARGYSMGYYGSVILMIICLFIVMNYKMFVVFKDEWHAMRFSFLLVGIWWLGFSSLVFRILPENSTGRKSTGNIWLRGYQEINKVWNGLKHSPDLKRYLLAFFFFNMGVQTVMYLATLFGTDEMRLPGDRLILSILLIQLVGSLGAWFFARVSQRKGNKLTLCVMILLWIVVCITAYFINQEYQFYGLAVLVGLVMGGIQSLARATYSKLIPENTSDTASYFSFFDVTYNVSIVLGTFSYGLINQITGSMRNSALALAVYFVIGMIFLMTVKSKDIQRPVNI